MRPRLWSGQLPRVSHWRVSAETPPDAQSRQLVWRRAGSIRSRMLRVAEWAMDDPLEATAAVHLSIDFQAGVACQCRLGSVPTWRCMPAAASRGPWILIRCAYRTLFQSCRPKQVSAYRQSSSLSHARAMARGLTRRKWVPRYDRNPVLWPLLHQ